MEEDEKFMRQALHEAQAGFSKGEVPVGCVLVYKGEVVARAHNLVETLKDATAHAEVLCLREGSRKIGNWRLLGAVLYSTLEPCSMCAGAMLLSRIGGLVWGAPDLRQGANGSWTDLLDSTHPIHNFPVRKGVCSQESAALMKEFFQLRRGEAYVGNAF